MSSGLEGTTLGQYRLTERLGRGGMAEVYKAYQPSLDRYVAIKILHAYFAEEEDFRNRFQREARAVARLRHPNIVQIYDFGAEGAIYYMAMEFLAGGTLKQHLRSVGELLPHKEVLRIVERVAAALDYAHARGIYHRDVKPANIMLTEDNEVILTDFGLAKMAEGSQHTRSGVSVGTPEYMAPEQGQGLPIDHRADIYSLGVVLYELLTGQLPFTADTPVAIIFKHIKDPLPLPRVLNPGLSEDIERTVLKALAKSPDDRYQHAGELAVSLRQAMAAAGDELPTPPPAPAPDSRVLSQETPTPPSPPPTIAGVADTGTAAPPLAEAAVGAAAAATAGGRVEQGVKHAVSRVAGAAPTDDWATIGERMEERTRRTAARWAGVEGEGDWEVIGQKLGERFEAKVDVAVDGHKKGEKDEKKREEKREEKEEKSEPGRGGKKWFLVGCLAFLALCACCVCSVLALSNCDRRDKPQPAIIQRTPGASAPAPVPTNPPPPERPEMRRYQNLGLSLRYPADWKEAPLSGPLGEGVQFVSPDPNDPLSYTLYARPGPVAEIEATLRTFRTRSLDDRVQIGDFKEDTATIGGEKAVGGDFEGTYRQNNQPIHGQIWVLGHGSRIYVIVAVAPAASWNAAQEVFQGITKSIEFAL